MFLDYAALFLVFFIVVFIFYAIIVIHDIPYEIAHKRNHPHHDAIHVAGWVSMFTLHTIWPFLWIWATLYREDRGWGFQAEKKGDEASSELEKRVDDLAAQVETLQAALAGQSEERED